MRILIVTQTYLPYFERGAPAFMLPALVRQLTLRGHRVTVLTADFGPRSQPPPPGAEVVYLPSVMLYRTLTWNPGVGAFCRARLREFDVVQTCGLYDFLGPVVARYCRRFRVPYLIEPMGMTRPIDRSLQAKRFWHSFFGSSYLANAALFLCTSELERREVIASGIAPERVLIRPNGVDLTEFSPLPSRGTFRREFSIPPGDRLILFLSRLIPRKGADLLIDAFAETCPGGWLVIAGPEGERGYVPSLKRRAAARGVAGRVLFPGPLMHERKLAAYVDCDVFVLPSRYENFANVIVEAIACGRPVIVTDRCGVSEFVAGRAGVVIPYERPALAAALRALFSDPALYARLQSETSRLAREFDWGLILPMVESWMEQVINKHSPAGRAPHS